jgi:Domain of Unknown Function (DUF928)
MNKIYPLRKYLFSKLLPSFVVVLSLFLTNLAFANSSKPRKGKPTTPTIARGVRGGCDGKAETELTILAPVFGKTFSTNPTFFWSVPNGQSYPMELRIFEYNEKGRDTKLATIDLSQSTPGIKYKSLAKEEYTLQVGKRYLWQILLKCDANGSSPNLFTEAVVEVVAAPSNLAEEISRTKDPRKRAELYVNAGFWYEAFREIFNEPSSKAYKLMFLEKLSKLAPEIALGLVDESLKQDKDLNNDLLRHAEQLRTIANSKIRE